VSSASAADKEEERVPAATKQDACEHFIFACPVDYSALPLIVIVSEIVI